MARAGVRVLGDGGRLVLWLAMCVVGLVFIGLLTVTIGVAWVTDRVVCALMGVER